MDRRYLIASGILFLVLVFACVWYLHRVPVALLDPAGPIAFGERRVILLTLLLSGVVVIPVFAMLFSFAWRYRASSPTEHIEHEPNWDHDNVVAELTWWLIPGLIIGVLSIVAWQSSHELDPFKPLPGGAPIEIQVVALNWKWLFLYPHEGIASVNLVEFPAGRPVHFTLTADAPMNTFWIPQLAGQIMVMPGMSTQLNLQADRAGDFRGLSGNISGEGFAGMTFVARAVSQSDFDAWIASSSVTQSLDSGAYATLAAPSAYNPVAIYALRAPNLYSAIIHKYMSAPATSSMQDMHMTP